MYQITYQKSNGEIIVRRRLSLPIYDVIGKGINTKYITSMNWTILEIKRV